MVPGLPIVLLIVLGCARLGHAASIPKLYNTGVNEDGTLLEANQIDPHYTLTASADPTYPGPEVRTLVAGFPVGPWLAEGPASRWIAPRAQQGTGNQEGDYTYKTTFDLTGFDPTKATITGKWAVDNTGVDILLNGVSLGLANGAGFGAFSDFSITEGFVAGTNTLEFQVNNAPSGINPTGFRAELRGTVELAGEPPHILTSPVAQTVIAGDAVTLSVDADGTPPLSYEWKFNDQTIPGATDATYVLDPITASQDGNYIVTVKNGSGQAIASARVSVLDVVPGVFDTGVDSAAVVLADGSVDPHYKLVTNPDSGAEDSIVADSTVFPIVAGPWLAETEQSKWIGPLLDTTAAAGGDYVYRMILDLTGYDPTTVLVRGGWTSDNAGVVRLNGILTGVVNSGNFDTLNPFVLNSGFLSGTNLLEFTVNNASVGYTGLRVQGLRAGAHKKTGPPEEPPRLVSQPVGGVLLVAENFTLNVLADGTKPLSYEWSRDGQPLPGKTDPTLQLTAVTAADAGDYTVKFTNVAGSTNSAIATVVVLDRVAGVFGTGVDDTGAPLADGVVDTHYVLTQNATDPTSASAFVHDSTVFPIVTGPWLPNGNLSKWIAPITDSSTASGGDYTYRTQFDLTGFDLATVVLQGGWATDNLGTDLKLNGISTGLINTVQFTGLTPFILNTGFQPGTNTLEFLVNNSDAVMGATGLRVENLRVGARPKVIGSPRLNIRRDGETVVVSWPTTATGYSLFMNSVVATNGWLTVTLPVAQVNGTNEVTLGTASTATFFRLER